MAIPAIHSSANAQSTFTVVALPDTQVYSEIYPEIFEAQTNWVRNERFIRDIRYVSHYGDIVQNGDSLVQWLIGDAAMFTLDLEDDLPYGINAGNHDVTASGIPYSDYIPELYLQFFGPQRFSDKSWFNGASPSGMSNYQIIDAGGIEFLMLNIECDTPLRELEWAQGILDKNRDKPTLLTTHRYLQDAEDVTFDVPLVPSGRYPSVWYAIEPPYTPDGIQSNQLFNWFIRRNPSIFMVNCGHFSEEFRQASFNVEDRIVHEVLADYQSDDNGGNGFLRILNFDTAANRIDIQSYSPWIDDYDTDFESQFSLNVDFQNYRETEGFAIFHNGINGYSGTQDTWLNEDEPNQSYGDGDTRWADDDYANSIFNDYQAHVLIRFDDIVGPEAASRIPQGSVVTKAILNLEIESDIDGPFNPEFYVWEMTLPWEENSTWNSLDDGLNEGDDLGEYLGSFLGDNIPDGESLRRLDITSVVQNWVNGEDNFGIAITPEIVTLNDEGIAIWTSEASNPLLRPTLEVWFDATQTFEPADLNQGGDVNGADLAIVLLNWNIVDSVADLNSDGFTDGADLALVLLGWTG